MKYILIILLSLYLGYEINDRSTIFSMNCDPQKYSSYHGTFLEQFKETRYENPDSIEDSGIVCLHQSLRMVRETNPKILLVMVLSSFNIYL